MMEEALIGFLIFFVFITAIVTAGLIALVLDDEKYLDERLPPKEDSIS